MPDNDKARDRYYQKKYSVGLDWYNQTLAEQGGGCAGCGHPAKTILLSIDHDHKWKYIKIETGKTELGFWQAWATYRGNIFACQEPKKNNAIRGVRKLLQRASVRGILCFPCNGALRKLRDNPQIAENLARYLRKHQNAN